MLSDPMFDKGNRNDTMEAIDHIIPFLKGDADMIRFASGIYFSKFYQLILKFAEKNLPDDKKVFLICTHGGSSNYKSIEQILDKKHASVDGKFGCKDTIHLGRSNWLEVLQEDIRMIKISKMQWKL